MDMFESDWSFERKTVPAKRRQNGCLYVCIYTQGGFCFTYSRLSDLVAMVVLCELGPAAIKNKSVEKVTRQRRNKWPGKSRPRPR